MRLLNTERRYGAVSQWFHWVTVALVIVLLVTGKAGGIEAEEPGNFSYYWHSSLGILVLVLSAGRVIWHVVTPRPRLPLTMPKVQRGFARAVHAAFYVLLLALPLSGWLAATEEGASVGFFGLGVLPDWGMSVGSAAESEEEIFEEIHEVLGNLLLVLAVLHALAALKHHFWNKDGVMASMIPGDH